MEQGKRIVSENADNKLVHRVFMVNLMLRGLFPKLLAVFCGDSERTLQTWLKKVDEIGWETLATVKQTGRPNKLNDERISKIKDVVNLILQNLDITFGMVLHYLAISRKNIALTMASEHVRSLSIKWASSL